MRLENRKLPSYPQPYKVIDGCLYREVRTKNGSFDQKLCNRFLQMLHKTFLDYREEFYQTGLHSHRRLPEIVAWLRIGMLMLVGFLEEQMC